MLVFSGMANPRWVLDSDTRNQLCVSGKMKNSNCESTKLGYQGFRLTADGNSIKIINDQYSELLILMSAPSILNDQVIGHVIDRINKPTLTCNKL